MQTIQLKKNADRRLRQGHCWIYSNEINTDTSPLKSFSPGEQAQLLASNGKAIGTVFINPNTLICGRLISRNPNQFMDQSLVVHRLNIALSLRERSFNAPFYRAVYGDSDGLPGLVIDRFGETFSIQISSAGMELLKDDIVAALVKVAKPRSIIMKNDGKMREVEALPSYVSVAYGEEISEVDMEENGVAFRIPLVDGQKTGWFYDHRMSRARLAAYVSGKRVLDLFSYVGGWGVQAAAFGAEWVTCADASGLALDFAEKSAALNKVQDKMEFMEGDAFEACKQLRAEGRKFDVVICDPPAFIPRKKDFKAGAQAYKRINQLALQLLDKDGLLVTGSCSMHLSREDLIDCIRSTVRATDRHAQIIEQGYQGPDHPIHPAIKETEYLKALFVRVIPSL